MCSNLFKLKVSWRNNWVLLVNQELKIEGEQPEVMEDDDLDLMLPAKKKKPKKVEFVDEGDVAEKDDGEWRFRCIFRPHL